MAVRVWPVSVCLMVILTPGINAPEVSFTTPTMVAVAVCAKARQVVPSAINTTIAITNVTNERGLTPVLLTIHRSFRIRIYESEINKYGRRPGLYFRLLLAVCTFTKTNSRLKTVPGNKLCFIYLFCRRLLATGLQNLSKKIERARERRANFPPLSSLAPFWPFVANGRTNTVKCNTPIRGEQRQLMRDGRTRDDAVCGISMKCSRQGVLDGSDTGGNPQNL